MCCVEESAGHREPTRLLHIRCNPALADTPGEDILCVLYDVFDFIEAALSSSGNSSGGGGGAPGRVLIHCSQGVSRSATLAIAYLMWKQGATYDDVFQAVKASRGVANPNIGFICQARLLLQWHKRRHAPVDSCRLWRVAPQSTAAPQYLVAKAVAAPRPSSLDPRGAFVLQGPASTAVWLGAACPEPFAAAAHRFAQQLQRYEGAPGPALVVRQGQEPEVFWTSLAAATAEGSGSRAGSPAAPGSAAAAGAAAAAAELVAAAAAGPVAVAENSAYDKDFELYARALTARTSGDGGDSARSGGRKTPREEGGEPGALSPNDRLRKQARGEQRPPSPGKRRREPQWDLSLSDLQPGISTDSAAAQLGKKERTLQEVTSPPALQRGHSSSDLLPAASLSDGSMTPRSRMWGQGKFAWLERLVRKGMLAACWRRACGGEMAVAPEPAITPAGTRSELYFVCCVLARSGDAQRTPSLNPFGSRTPMESLPDQLLGRIFADAGTQAGAAVTLVSRRWHHVFYSELALWRSLELTAASLNEAAEAGQACQWFAAKASLLRRVGDFVQHLSLSQMLEEESRGESDGIVLDMQQLAAGISAEWRLSSSVLAHLSPSTLQSLRLEWATVDAAAAAAMERLTSLTQLQIDCRGALPGCVIAALPSLQQLLSLDLWCGHLPGQLSTALQHLTRLTSLTCDSRRALPELSAVLPLAQLRQLRWMEERQSGVMQADLQQLLARLPHLERWDLISCRGMGDHASLEIGGAVLESCTAESCHWADGTELELELRTIESVPSLEGLVEAALPPRTEPSQLRTLAIMDGTLPLPAVLGCPFLGHLTRLVLSRCSFPDVGLLAGLEALLQQAPRLQDLSLLVYFDEPPLPAALVNRTGLRQLCLRYNFLTELPPGPYLHGLKVLDLGYNSWAVMPPALAAATSLTALSLANNPDLVLTTADVDGTLCRLPRLRRLYLDVSRVPPDVLGRLSACAPHLQVATLDPHRRLNEQE
ncbi:hypothetical protein COHA_007513 [Chlorella ohadii]|uniref:Uncharacterized protein n=1 Tax=Chlorella ohadii TaxID=2649997 RepID=A0AAD5H463_9CHLO|nr:hypothetical protein COHA_007513 [Chlorella ohadii]